ncbi:MAG: FixH family protein [Rhodoferax sp.]|nr:FixH family protein [Rhodoferax sp.]
MQQSSLDSSGPWWKYGHVWMVFAGPALVVVAGFITLYLAVTRPDPVITEEYYRKGTDASAASLAPALQARNHAQTGVVPTTKDISKP